jgi:hypothetical protein
MNCEAIAFEQWSISNFVFILQMQGCISLLIFSNVSGLSSTNQSKKSLKPMTGHEKRSDRYNLNAWVHLNDIRTSRIALTTHVAVLNKDEVFFNLFRMTSNALNKRCGVKLQAAGPPSTAVRGLSAKPSLRNGLATNPAEHDTVTMNDVKTVAKNNCLKTQDAALFKELYFWYILQTISILLVVLQTNASLLPVILQFFLVQSNWTIFFGQL